MSADDLSSKLSDAAKHFSSHSYDACSKILSGCPNSDSDPKLRANTFIVDYSKLGFAHTLQGMNNLRGLVNSSCTSNSNNNNNNNKPSSIPLVNVDSASWEFDGQDVLHYNEACLRAHTGDIDTALDVVTQLLSAKAPVSIRVQLKASALAFVLKRQLNVRNAANNSTNIYSTNTRDIQELLNHPNFKTQLSESDQKDLQGLVAAATASDLTSIQTWLDKNTSKGANDVAIFLNNTAVQLMYKNALSTIEDENENDNSQYRYNHHLSHLFGATSYTGSATAVQLLAQAAAAADASSPSEGCPMQTATIKFNLGLAHFAIGNLVPAITSMVQVQRVMSDNPVYWFRLGQMLSCLGREQAVAIARTKAETVQKSRAKLLHEKGDRPAAAAVVVNTLSEGLIDLTSGGSSSASNSKETSGTATPATTAATPTATGSPSSPNLAFTSDGSSASFSCAQLYALADTALQNAYVLIIGRANNCNHPNLSLNSNAPAPPASSTQNSPANTSNNNKADESNNSGSNNNSNSTGVLDLSVIVGQSTVGMQELIQSLIVHLTFVALSRGNNQVASKYVNDYFSVRCAIWNQNRDITASMLCYAVEALCTCNKPSQALKLLQSHDLGELIVDSNFVNGNATDGANKNSAGSGGGLLFQAYQDALLVNVCIAQVMNGNWQKALSIGTSLLPRLYQRSPNAVLLGAYLELARGNREKALEIFEKIPLREPI